MKYTALFLSLVLACNTAAAATGTFTIKGIGVSATSNSIFINVNETIAETNCNKNKTFRLRQADAELVFEEILSLLIMAKATGNSVSIAYQESECYAGASKLDYVYLR